MPVLPGKRHSAQGKQGNRRNERPAGWPGAAIIAHPGQRCGKDFPGAAGPGTKQKQGLAAPPALPAQPAAAAADGISRTCRAK